MLQPTEAKTYVSHTDADSIQIVTAGSGFDAYNSSAKTLAQTNTVTSGYDNMRKYKRGHTAIERSKNEIMLKMHNRMQ